MKVVSLAATWNDRCKEAVNHAAVGLVVGATDSDAMKKIRSMAPDVWILCPGVGSQGGDLQVCQFTSTCSTLYRENCDRKLACMDCDQMQVECLSQSPEAFQVLLISLRRPCNIAMTSMLHVKY